MSTTCPPRRFVLDLSSLLDLVLRPGWNGETQDLALRKLHRRQLRQAVERGEVKLITASSTLREVHLTVCEQDSFLEAARCFRIAQYYCAIEPPSLDLVALHQQLAQVVTFPNSTDMDDAYLLLLAMHLKIDGLICDRPDRFLTLMNSNINVLPNNTVPITSLRQDWGAYTWAVDDSAPRLVALP